MINFKDLETAGFLLIPKFIDRDIIEEIKEDYNLQKKIFLASTNRIKKHNIMSAGFDLSSKLADIILAIREHTNIKIGNPSTNKAYFDNQLTQFTWHQDHEPYFKSRDSYNAVNFWIPIIKPVANQSGIMVLPNDILQEKCPAIFANSIIGKGAKVLIPHQSHTVMRDDDLNQKTILPFNIEDIAVTPLITEGDLLIMRQDVIHKTQDFVTDRVAYSIRCFNPEIGFSPSSTKFDTWLRL
jgi:hypothetical protein